MEAGAHVVSLAYPTYSWSMWTEICLLGFVACIVCATVVLDELPAAEHLSEGTDVVGFARRVFVCAFLGASPLACVGVFYP